MWCSFIAKEKGRLLLLNAYDALGVVVRVSFFDFINNNEDDDEATDVDDTRTTRTMRMTMSTTKVKTQRRSIEFFGCYRTLLKKKRTRREDYDGAFEEMTPCTHE